ncbi:MAG: OB-fold nucleic acid binding domain-containing protein, partial [Smithellaceae bacterium]
MANFLTEDKRTHYCGDLRTSDVDKQVVLMGWTHRRRDHGGVIFVDLRDRTGIVQVVFNPDAGGSVHSQAHKIRSEFVLAVKGIVHRRPEGMDNPALKTGGIE